MRLVRYATESGDYVDVLVEDSENGDVVSRGWGQSAGKRVAEQANETIEAAVARVRPAADAVLSSLVDLHVAPSEVQVEFGIELSAEAGAVLANIGSAANFKIVLTWHSENA